VGVLDLEDASEPFRGESAVDLVGPPLLGGGDFSLWGVGQRGGRLSLDIPANPGLIGLGDSNGASAVAVGVGFKLGVFAAVSRR
jgi:hypothetical protein